MPLPRISLGEAFLVGVAFCATLAALRFAGEFLAGIVGFAVALTFLFALMTALFDRGASRAAGAGFALGMALYAGAFICASRGPDADWLGFRQQGYHDELNFANGTLPTTTLLEPLHNVLAVEIWTQTDTGETMRITRDAVGTLYDPWGRIFDPASPAVPRTWQEDGVAPESDNFLAVAHLGWACLFGYAGSLFARIAYVRGRSRTPQPRERAEDGPTEG